MAVVYKHSTSTFAKPAAFAKPAEELKWDGITNKVFVGGLSPVSTMQSMSEWFSYFGTVVEVDCKLDPHSGKGRGFGFVTFQETTSTQACLGEPQHVIDGKLVEVKPHREIPNSSGSSGSARPKQAEQLEWDGITDKVFVGGLPASVTTQTMYDYFQFFGELVEVDCKLDPHSGHCRGYGFVQFQDANSVGTILAEAQHMIDGKTVEVKPHRENPTFTGGLGSKSLPCKHFQQGRCNMGDNCNFSHDEKMIEAASAGQKTIVCRHWLQGKCNYGESCAFKHSQDEEGDAEKLKVMEAAGVDINAILHNVQAAFSAAKPLAPKSSQIGTVPCKHYALGKCNYGSQCSFSHADPPTGAAWQPSWTPAAQAAPAYGLDPNLCKFFQQGKCSFGDSCKFPHYYAEADYSYADYAAPGYAQPVAHVPASAVSITKTAAGASRYHAY